MRKVAFRIAILALSAIASGNASAQTADLIVEKKTFEMPSYTTQGGATIKNVKVGWQAVGTLNADRSNAILIPHFFTGTSHAFGKYAATDKAAGYWDYLIGPGKVIDTNKYYVISSDTLVNLNVHAPNVVTTGPASINPDTGKPYGMSFPVVTFKDFVNVQKALIESLGINKLHAVVGASMGGLQTYEWAASHPDMVGRIVVVVAAAGPQPYLLGWLDIWTQPIKLDPKWNNGDYYGSQPPLEGLKTSLRMITLQAQSWEWADRSFGIAPAEEGKDPTKSMANRFKIDAALDAAATARAATADANSLIYLAKAHAAIVSEPEKIKVPALVLNAPNDLLFFDPVVTEMVRKMRAAGVTVETGQLAGPNGHINGVVGVAQAGDKIKAFLDK